MDATIEGEFMKQFSGSATANLVFVAFFLVYMGCKKLCERKSRCHSTFHSCCLTVEIDDRTIRQKPTMVEV